MIDVHTHLNDEKLFSQSDKILKELSQYNINKVIVPSCDRIMIKNALKLLKHKNVFIALGIHPSNSDEWDDDIGELIIKTSKDAQIVAVGEIGLDLHYPNSNLKKQQKVFLKQLELAAQLKLPVILHLRDAWDEFFEIYNAHKELFVNGVDVHCFDGDAIVAKKLIDAGFFVSLTARSVENNSKREVINYLPLDKIMVETDSPYLLPHDYKDTEEFNTPKNVNWVAQKVAEYKGMTIKEIDDITTQNAYTLFQKLGEYDAGKTKR